MVPTGTAGEEPLSGGGVGRGPGSRCRPPALPEFAVGGDPAMAMLGVVPGEERTAEGGRGGDVFEPSGETGVVLQGLDTCASEKGLSSLTWGRLRERVTPRSARSWAVHLLVMGAVLLLVPALLALHESVATRWEDPPVQPSPATT